MPAFSEALLRLFVHTSCWFAQKSCLQSKQERLNKHITLETQSAHSLLLVSAWPCLSFCLSPADDFSTHNSSLESPGQLRPLYR